MTLKSYVVISFKLIFKKRFDSLFFGNDVTQPFTGQVIKFKSQTGPDLDLLPSLGLHLLHLLLLHVGLLSVAQLLFAASPDNS
jgi:hypothetical protein